MPTRSPTSAVTLRNGRFGPYVTDGTTNASLRRGDDQDEITIERASELLADRRAAGPPAKRARGAKKASKTAKKAAKTTKAAKATKASKATKARRPRKPRRRTPSPRRHNVSTSARPVGSRSADDLSSWKGSTGPESRPRRHSCHRLWEPFSRPSRALRRSVWNYADYSWIRVVVPPRFVPKPS